MRITRRHHTYQVQMQRQDRIIYHPGNASRYRSHFNTRCKWEYKISEYDEVDPAFRNCLHQFRIIILIPMLCQRGCHCDMSIFCGGNAECLLTVQNTVCQHLQYRNISLNFAEQAHVNLRCQWSRQHMVTASSFVYLNQSFSVWMKCGLNWI